MLKYPSWNITQAAARQQEIRKSMKILQPPGWPKPKGYSNGIAASGRMIFVGGQIGWDANEEFRSLDFPGQVHQALLNTLVVLEQGGAGPGHITRMTWYITSRDEYLASLKPLGKIYRETIGSHYPAMTMVEVNALMEAQAKVEIETTAVVPGR